MRDGSPWTNRYLRTLRNFYFINSIYTNMHYHFANYSPDDFVFIIRITNITIIIVITTITTYLSLIYNCQLKFSK